LIGANHRVSTQKDTSTSDCGPPIRVTIDKLILSLACPITETDLKGRLGKTKKQSRLIKLRDRRWYLQVGEPSLGAYFGLRGRNAPTTSTLITNPSKYESFEHYDRELQNLLSPQELTDLKITRLDLALDYKQPLSSILRGFDFRKKQEQVSFQDRGANRQCRKAASLCERQPSN